MGGLLVHAAEPIFGKEKTIMTWWGHGVFEGDIPESCREKLFEIVGSPLARRREPPSCLVSLPITSARLGRMFRHCKGAPYSDDELTLSASMTVLAEFVIQNHTSVAAAMASAIRRPIRYEKSHMDVMGWEDPDLRSRNLSDLLVRFTTHLEFYPNPSRPRAAELRQREADRTNRAREVEWTARRRKLLVPVMRRDENGQPASVLRRSTPGT